MCHQLEVVGNLSPLQRAEVILDEDDDNLENNTVVNAVLTSFLESPDDDELTEFFQNFTVISQQVLCSHQHELSKGLICLHT